MSRKESVRARVNRGIELLDRKAPDWQYSIDICALKMSSFRWCVLGQTFGHFDVGCKKLHIRNAARYGFTAIDGYSSQEWEEIEYRWGNYLVSYIEEGSRT